MLSLFTSCGTSSNNDSKDIIEKLSESVDINFKIDVQDIDFLYKTRNLESGVYAFTVSDNGELYYSNWIKCEITGRTNEIIDIIDLNGEIINTIDFSKFAWDIALDDLGIFEDELEYLTEPLTISLDSLIPSSMVIKNYILYFAVMYDYIEEFTCIYKYDIIHEKLELFAIIDNFLDVKTIVVLENLLYLHGRETKSPQSTNRNNENESVKSLNLETREVETVFNESPIGIAGTSDGGLMICAYDEDKSSYFQKLGSDTRVYINLRDYSNKFHFDMFGDSSIIYSSGEFLILATFEENGMEREIVRDLMFMPFSKPFTTESGYLFYNTREGIRRVSIKELTLGTVLNIAHTTSEQSEPVSYTPTPIFPRLGIQTRNEIVGYYDLAFEILSNNDQYDMYYLHSQHDISDNIRRRGAFYTLNDIPGIWEYLDAVFPYVKDAALDENDDIWMLPVALDTTLFLYNERLADEFGIDIDSINTFENLTFVINDLRERNIPVDSGAQYEWFFDRYFYQIMRINNGFSREDFRTMAEFFYEYINFVKGEWSFQNNQFRGDDNSISEDYFIIIDGIQRWDNRGRYLFSPWFFSGYRGFVEIALSYEDFDDELFMENMTNNNVFFTYIPINYIRNRFMMFPPVAGMMENDVTAEFIAVNPNSNNLDEVIEFLTRLIEYQMNLENSFILKDRSTYTDRHYINDAYDILNYKDNFIRFSISSDLIYDNFRAFLGDEITLDEYLNRAEFKINAYLNE